MSEERIGAKIVDAAPELAALHTENEELRKLNTEWSSKNAYYLIENKALRTALQGMLPYMQNVVNFVVEVCEKEVSKEMLAAKATAEALLDPDNQKKG